MSYRIEYSPDVEGHLRALTARQQTTILDTVDKQLAYQPTVETRNRKPMRPNPVAPWELRVAIFGYTMMWKRSQSPLCMSVLLVSRNVITFESEGR